MIGDILSGIGTVLSLPRNLLYQHIISPLMGEDIQGFGDILKQVGMDPENFATKALGFAGDVATDPLTWGGGLAARGLRNAMFGGGTTKLGKAAASTGAGLSTTPELRALAEEVPVLYGAKLGPTAEMAKYEPGWNVLGESPTGRVKAGVTSWPNEPYLFDQSVKMTGEVPFRFVANHPFDLPTRAGLTARKFAVEPEAFSQFQAAYDPGADLIFNTAQRPALNAAGQLGPDAVQALANRRHEMVHALVEGGATNPAIRSELAALPRAAAGLRGSERPFLQGLGVVADEMAGHAAEARSLLGQARNAGSVLFDPERVAAYQSQVAAKSPLAAWLYGMAPSTFPLAGAGAGYGLSSRGY